MSSRPRPSGPSLPAGAGHSSGKPLPIPRCPPPAPLLTTGAVSPSLSGMFPATWELSKGAQIRKGISDEALLARRSGEIYAPFENKKKRRATQRCSASARWFPITAPVPIGVRDPCPGVLGSFPIRGPTSPSSRARRRANPGIPSWGPTCRSRRSRTAIPRSRPRWSRRWCRSGRPRRP